MGGMILTMVVLEKIGKQSTAVGKVIVTLENVSSNRVPGGLM